MAAARGTTMAAGMPIMAAIGAATAITIAVTWNGTTTIWCGSAGADLCRKRGWAIIPA